MPRIQSLRIQNFRNLSNINVGLFKDFNYFWGSNGSGKTSFLEAIYFAATGRSFRTPQIPYLIKSDTDAFCIGATVLTEKHPASLSIQRTRSGSRSIQWDGKKLTGFAPVAQEIPVQFISTLSYRFFTDGPKIRRQFFDWAMFHVKPLFRRTWKEWERLLTQRNATLKQRYPRAQVQAWDEGLCELAKKIDDQRIELLESITPLLNKHLRLLRAPFKCELHYDRGWPLKSDLEVILRDQIERDYALGYTYSGPQRADFQLLVHNAPAANVLSQGQQKLAMYAMHLTQGYFLQQETAKSPIYLIDDMASELDLKTQDTVLNHLAHSLNAQLFLTGITPELFANHWVKNSSLFEITAGKMEPFFVNPGLENTVANS
jgi:DNA replication and repair protein RecF